MNALLLAFFLVDLVGSAWFGVGTIANIAHRIASADTADVRAVLKFFGGLLLLVLGLTAAFLAGVIARGA